MRILKKKVKKYLKSLLMSFLAPFKKSPDFIIIGTQKGGTSSLFYYLNQHPQLKGSIKKETHFFDKFYNKGIKWYKSHFPYIWDKRLAFEATPYYIYHPAVPLRIKKYFKNIKFIILLRDPLDRAYSHYMMEYKRGRETKSFLEALKLENKRLKGEEVKILNNTNYISQSHKNFSYIDRGLYIKQLERWFSHFKEENFLILKSENFFRYPKEELKKAYSFLNIKHCFPANLEPKNIGYYNRVKLQHDIPSKVKQKITINNKRLYEKFKIKFESFK